LRDRSKAISDQKDESYYHPRWDTKISEMHDKLGELKQSLLELDVVLDVKLNANLHDREIRLDTWLGHQDWARS